MLSQVAFRSPFQAARPAPAVEQPPAAPAEAPKGDAAKDSRGPGNDGGKKRGIGSTIINLPRKAIEGVFGLAGGVVGAVSHTLPGTIEGISEGLASDHARGKGGTGWYNVIMLGEAVAAGAVIGSMFTPFGAVAGGIAGAVGGLIYRGLEGHAGVPQRFCQKIDSEVDKANVQNTQGSKVQIAVQNATEGAIIGTGIGFKEGFSIGREAGKGVVSGVLDVAYGVGEGVFHAVFGPHK
jgi:hypothetical protein